MLKQQQSHGGDGPTLWNVGSGKRVVEEHGREERVACYGVADDTRERRKVSSVDKDRGKGRSGKPAQSGVGEQGAGYGSRPRERQGRTG